MALNIIRRRLARALALQDKNTVQRQRRNPEKRRRASYTKGERALNIIRSVTFSKGLDDRLNQLCERFKVTRGVVIRDAVEFYLGMAEQEYEDVGALTAHDVIPPALGPGKVRRASDGAIISTIEVNPGSRRST